ncbi:MAG: hypothetical protein Q8M88_08530 [Phenylobacterium sp.]|uniref:hypothetical protein n=1 Tax=Phenylobacterium sp. TaxID=1871053 RepID=UPI0027322D2C|nr:hypothetical protein [Phenylobacterium sp.]MDP3174463.1 hypothetical protein [Phenylobacterium sp.]
MKALKLIGIGFLLFFAVGAHAQISIHVDLVSPPQWGPSGYSEVRYYYLPDVEAYYDVPSAMFIYFNGVTWIHRRSLPSRYRNYDLYNGYKVVMTDYRGNAPYSTFKNYKSKYKKGYRGEPQKNYGERAEREYSHEREYSKGSSSQGNKHDNGNKKNSKGHGNGKNK